METIIKLEDELYPFQKEQLEKWLLTLQPKTRKPLHSPLTYALGISQEDDNLNDIAELDKKNFGISHMGRRNQVIPGKNRGSSTGKRSLSKEQICSMTDVERNGRSNSNNGNI